jgi:hypothetical protein
MQWNIEYHYWRVDFMSKKQTESKPCSSCECDPCDCDWGLYEETDESSKGDK